MQIHFTPSSVALRVCKLFTEIQSLFLLGCTTKRACVFPLQLAVAIGWLPARATEETCTISRFRPLNHGFVSSGPFLGWGPQLAIKLSHLHQKNPQWEVVGHWIFNQPMRTYSAKWGRFFQAWDLLQPSGKSLCPGAWDLSWNFMSKQKGPCVWWIGMNLGHGTGSNHGSATNWLCRLRQDALTRKKTKQSKTKNASQNIYFVGL